MLKILWNELGRQRLAMDLSEVEKNYIIKEHNNSIQVLM